MSPVAPRAGAMPDGTPAPASGGSLSRSQKNRLRRQEARIRALLGEPVTYAEQCKRGDVIAAGRRHDQRARAEKRTADARSLEQLRREAEEKRTHPKLVVDPEWAFRQGAAKRPPATVMEAK